MLRHFLLAALPLAGAFHPLFVRSSDPPAVASTTAGVPGAALPWDGLHGPSREPSPPPRSAGACGPLERIAVIGASASAGFLLPTDLAETLEWLLACDHQPVVGTASSRFFLDPFGYARQQVSVAQAAQPTAVVALDFLFWFAYGFAVDEPYRLRMLDSGLGFLERFDCVVLTSTVPDMRAAIGRMLTADQVPDPETLVAVNRRIEEWAAGRSNVVLVSLPEWHGQLLEGEPFRIGDRLWPEAGGGALLQWDQLHPSIDGLALLTCKVLESLVEARGDLSSDLVRLDPTLVAGPLHARMESIMETRAASGEQR